MKLAAPALTLAILAACATRGAPVVAPVEVAIAPVAKNADGGASNALPASEGCSVHLTIAGKIDKGSPTCVLDERISKHVGVLHYPCSGDGDVEAVFDDHHYQGQLEGGRVTLEKASKFDWTDGCSWGTNAVISGALLSYGEPATTPLRWTYRDHVVEGSGCSSACSARALLRVTSSSEAPPKMPVFDDDDDGD